MLVVIDVKCLMEVFDNAQLSAWRSGCIIDGTIMPWSLGVVSRTTAVKDLISPWFFGPCELLSYGAHMLED